MANISFEINGRKVNPSNIKDALESAIFQSVSSQIKQKVGSIICSEHYKSPKIVVKGRSMSSLSFEVSGCCEDLMKKVTAKLK